MLDELVVYNQRMYCTEEKGLRTLSGERLPNMVKWKLRISTLVPAISLQLNNTTPEFRHAQVQTNMNIQ